MTEKIKNLLENSGLPGPRGNLGLMYSFAKNASLDDFNECLLYYKDDLHNSPEEFVVMCGIVGLCIYNKNNIESIITYLRKLSSHKSWRLREAVAMGLQEIGVYNINYVLTNLKPWISGNDLEKRAIVAALCEPKLLKDKNVALEVLLILFEITMNFKNINCKLSDNQKSLQKTLGYGWSVAIVNHSVEGKKLFEELLTYENRHIKWIVNENLKKKRLQVMDKNWVDNLQLLIKE